MRAVVTRVRNARVEIDGRVWDGSLRGRLEELRGLLRGAVL